MQASIFCLLCLCFSFTQTLQAGELANTLLNHTVVENIEGISLQILDDAAAKEAWLAQPKTLNTHAILLEAQSLIGIAYATGGTSPSTGFDCSGFVRYVFHEAAQIPLPANAKAMGQVGQSVNKDALQAGDLVFFNTLKTVDSHVGIYVGDHQFIHAPSPGGVVRIENMQLSYWTSRFNGAKRISLQ